MKDVLFRKLVRLGRGEDGAALMVTLALFMFMYASISGVFAIGRQVKNRIHLQNACDAAAYSAAVVQADTLSRIATINRAMSWTYISMTRRQMDYIVWRWLDGTVRKVKGDVALAKASGSACPHHSRYWSLTAPHPGMPYCGVTDDENHSSVTVELNDTHKPRVATVKERNSYFTGNRFRHESFYAGQGAGIGVLERQLDADFETLAAMHEAESDLLSRMEGRIDATVRDVLLGNAVAGLKCRYMLSQKSPFAYTHIMDSANELCFLGFSGFSPDNAALPFGAGSGAGQWLPLKSGEGFYRKYVQRGVALKSEWCWRAWRWICQPSGDCLMSGGGHHENEFPGQAAYNRYFDGETAKPYVLGNGYFGPAGTITVGLACFNENPWYAIFRNSAGIDGRPGLLSGIFGAFNPYSDVDWTWTFSSAKAGYRFKGEENDGNREYMVHWDENEQSWNLCQSDWDAVFVPVRRASSVAKGATGEQTWTYSESAPVADWIEKGGWNPLSGTGSTPAYAAAGIPGLPGMHDSSGAISDLEWGRIADLMYH